MPLIIESNDLFSRLKMIESLRRFSVTKLLSSPGFSRLSSVSLLRLSLHRGRKKREEVLQILTVRGDDEGGKRRNVISGQHDLETTSLSSGEQPWSETLEFKCTTCFIMAEDD